MTNTTVTQAQAESESFFDDIYSSPDLSDTNGHNDELDAFRHAYTSAVIAYEQGAGIAAALGWAHEAVNTLHIPPQPHSEWDMDSFNNQQGRDVAGGISANDPDYKEHIAAEIADRLNNGELVVLASHFADSSGSHYSTPSEAADKAQAQAYQSLLNSGRSEWDYSDNENYAGAPVALPSWLSPISAAYATSLTTLSPLVLDTDGSGTIELAAVNGAGSVYWDIDSDGFREATGWITGGDGLLCIDLNSDGIVTGHSELFGSQTGGSNGYVALSAYDTNSSGTITSADTQFGNLRIWIDTNADGYSQSGELHTLSSLGITSISTSYSNVSYAIAGNDIKQESTFVMNGNTYTSVDAWFAYDNINSEYAGSYTLDVATLFLPDLRGYGTLPDLHVAMSQDSTLLAMVEEVAGYDLSDLANPTNDLHDKLTDIMFRWAGVDGVNPTSRGAYIDARALGFLEEMMGQPYLSFGSNPNPPVAAADILNKAWAQAFGTFSATLLAQAGVSEIYGSTYSPVDDAFSGGHWINGTQLRFNTTGADTLYSSNTNNLYLYRSGDSPSSFDHISAINGGKTSLLFDGISPNDVRTWTDGSNNLNLQYTATDTIILPASFSSGVSLAGYGTIAFGDGTVWDFSQGLRLIDTDSVHNLSGSALGDVIEGRGGGDSLYGYAGNDILTGGTGADYLVGSLGNDGYVFASGDGADTIVEYVSEGTDSITMSGYDSADVRLYTDSSGYLHIVSKANSADNITVNAGVTGTGTYESTVGGRIEQIVFDDTTLSLAGGLIMEGSSSTDNLYGTQYDDTLSAAGGTDTIYANRGNDTLIGGAAADTLYGGVGNDTYVFSAGDGADIITEYASEGTDSITLSGYNAANVRLYTDSSGYLHIVSKANSADNITAYAGVTGTGTYESTIGGRIEQIVFNDATVSLAGGLTMEGSSSGEGLYGTQYNDTLSSLAGTDSLYGNRGNDTLIGGAGGDTLTGGTGDDTYVFASGDGADTITEYASEGNDTITLSGYNAADVRLYTDSSGYLHIVSKADGSDNLTVYAGTTGSGVSESTIVQRIEHIVFADASVDLTTGGLPVEGTSSGENIYGTANADTIRGLAGNDFIYANAGNDTLLGGDGNDSLDGGTGTDTVSYADATAAVTVNLSTTSGQNTVGSGTDTITNCENLTGSSYNDTLTGNTSANVIQGGAGTDTIHGGDGADTLYGGLGTDTLYGDAGADIFAFEVSSAFSNVDTIADFNTGQSDKINIHDILTGHYDPLTMAITDFVQITQSGGNSALFIDRDGTGGSYGFDQIASLTGAIGLTDEAALVTAGTLIV